MSGGLTLALPSVSETLRTLSSLAPPTPTPTPAGLTLRFSGKLILPSWGERGGVQGRPGRGGGKGWRGGGVYTFQLPEKGDQVQTQVISVVHSFQRRELLFGSVTNAACFKPQDMLEALDHQGPVWSSTGGGGGVG